METNYVDPASGPLYTDGVLIIEARGPEILAKRIMDMDALTAIGRVHVITKEDAAHFEIMDPTKTVLVVFTLDRAMTDFGTLIERYPEMGVVGVLDDCDNVTRLLLDFDDACRSSD